MRTTVTIDDDVLEVARLVAREEQVSLGSAISWLARRGISGEGNVMEEHSSGLPVFDVPDDAETVTASMVSRALED